MEGPAGGLLETPRCLQGDTKLRTRPARRGTARDSRAGQQGPSGGVRLGGAGHGRHSGQPEGVRSPPGASSYARPESQPGRMGLKTPAMRYRLEPGVPGDVPPPHNSRSLTLGPGSRSASSSSSSGVGMARTLSLLRSRPAGSGGRCGQAEDGRGWRPRRQRGGGRDSVNAQQTRWCRHPHSRPFKRRLRAVLPVRAGPRAGPAYARTRDWAGAWLSWGRARGRGLGRDGSLAGPGPAAAPAGHTWPRRPASREAERSSLGV